MFEAATVDDVYHAYSGLQLGNDAIYSCIGVSGEGHLAAPATPPQPPQVTIITTIKRELRKLR